MRMLLWMSLMTTASLFGSSPQEAPPPAESQPTRENAASATGFLYRTIEAGDETYAYCVYVPPEYTPERAWPVILFLHGSGERGQDGFLQTDVGIARAIRRNRKLCPAIVVMPQCRSGEWWQDEMLEIALRCVEETSLEYHFDRQRVYLTGLSMGGAGTWRLASRMPDAFAALVPICGFWGRPEVAAPPAELKAAAAKLARLPIWCFHGGADRAVPVQRSRELVEAVRVAGGEIQYTEVPEAGHNVWDRAYGKADLWRWLLAQKRETRPEEAP